jgi:hypothetical protein
MMSRGVGSWLHYELRALFVRPGNHARRPVCLGAAAGEMPNRELMLSTPMCRRERMRPHVGFSLARGVFVGGQLAASVCGCCPPLSPDSAPSSALLIEPHIYRTGPTGASTQGLRHWCLGGSRGDSALCLWRRECKTATSQISHLAWWCGSSNTGTSLRVRITEPVHESIYYCSRQLHSSQ